MAVMTQLLLAALSPYLALSAYLDVGIVNGTEAKPYSRPYMVSVQKDGQHICGGFLVSEHFVMTAAHCWKGEKKLTVVLGAHDLSKKDPALVHMAVKFYHVHPMYNSNTLSGDIMLLQLNKKAKKSKRVNWISIPKKEAAVKAKACSVAGWGRQADKGPVSVCLLEANVSVLDKKICQQWTRPSSSMLCAGGPEGFCQGDSGGPLVCKNTAVGIVSFYIGKCTAQSRLNVYTQISKFLPWIKALLKSIN